MSITVNLGLLSPWALTRVTYCARSRQSVTAISQGIARQRRGARARVSFWAGRKRADAFASARFRHALSDAKIKATSPDGKSEEISLKAGETRWREPLVHAVENIGTTEARVLAVEMKKPEH